VASSFARAVGPTAPFVGALIAATDGAADDAPETVVSALLDRGADVLDADLLVAVGPAGDEASADGDACRVPIGVETPDRRAVRTVTLIGDPSRVRAYARGTAMHLARLAACGAWWDD
jgi:hypothetical protein